jgi:Protein of unknown function (DUF2752)
MPVFELRELRELRSAGAMMLAAAVVLPVLPGHPGIACPLRALTGVPCPFCGLTTSVVDSAHGDVRGALSANPAGLAAVVLALFLLLARPRSVAVPLIVAVAGLAGMWLFEFHRFGYL